MLVVTPSCALTKTVMSFEPKLSDIAPEALPDVTAAPLTVIVALAWVRDGVTVIDEVELETDAV